MTDGVCFWLFLRVPSLFPWNFLVDGRIGVAAGLHDHLDGMINIVFMYDCLVRT